MDGFIWNAQADDRIQYQELFAICQGLPGPGSTKMIFCLALLHAGFIPALLVFLIWRFVVLRSPSHTSKILRSGLWELISPTHSLPGAAGMFALSIGVQRMNEVLPAAVYAVLSGLNASTVGIIALAAVQLAEKAIRDKLSRVLVILGACAGLCYNALWYFPLLMSLGGLAAVIWDGWMSQKIGKLRAIFKRKKRDTEDIIEGTGTTNSVPLEETVESQSSVQKRRTTEPSNQAHSTVALPQSSADVQPRPAQTEDSRNHVIRIKAGVLLVIVFFGKNCILYGRLQILIPSHSILHKHRCRSQPD